MTNLLVQWERLFSATWWFVKQPAPCRTCREFFNFR